LPVKNGRDVLITSHYHSVVALRAKATEVVRRLPRAGAALPVHFWAITANNQQKKWCCLAGGNK
jgi:hypothetical protein